MTTGNQPINLSIGIANLLLRFRRILLTAISLSTIFITFVVVYNTLFNDSFYWKFTICIFYSIVAYLNRLAISYIIRLQPISSTIEEMHDIGVLSGVFNVINPEVAEEKTAKAIAEVSIHRLPLTSYQFESNDTRIQILNHFLTKYPEAVYIMDIEDPNNKFKLQAEINARKMSMEGKQDAPIILLGNAYNSNIKTFEKIGIYVFLLCQQPTDLDFIDDRLILNNGKLGKQSAKIMID